MHLTVYPYWIIAKMILFVVAVSASIKAFGPNASTGQFKAGLLVASLAYAAILGLIVAKPFGLYLPGHVQSVTQHSIK